MTEGSLRLTGAHLLGYKSVMSCEKKKKIPGAKYKVRVITLDVLQLPRIHLSAPSLRVSQHGCTIKLV